MACLMRITEEASSRKSSSLSSLSDHRSSAASLKRGTTGVTGAYIPPFNFEVHNYAPDSGSPTCLLRRVSCCHGLLSIHYKICLQTLLIAIVDSS